MSSAPCAWAIAGERGVEAVARRDDAHVAGGGLGDDRRDVGRRRAAKAASTAATSLYGSTIVSPAAAPVTPGESGSAERGDAGAGRGEQRVDVPVVAAGELDDLACGR